MIEMLLAAAGQPWIYAVVLVGCIIDGFFPPFPSEAVLVGLASLIVAQGGPNPWLLFLAAALGAFLGDNIAFWLGRRAGTTRFGWMRRPFMQRSFARAGRELERRAVPMILVGRFIPVARVAVNLTAGATGHPWGSFRAITAFSACLWAGYSLGIGVLAGAWFREFPLLGLIIGITVSGMLGLLIDKAHAVLRSRIGGSRADVADFPAAAVEPAERTVELAADKQPAGVAGG